MGGNGKNPSSANALSLTASPTIPQQSQNVNNNPSQAKPLTKEEFMQQEQQRMTSAKNNKEVETHKTNKDREKSKDKDLEI